MKKVLFLLLALVYGQITFAQSSDLQTRVYKAIGEEENRDLWREYITGYLRSDKTEDEAYEAPNSRLFKTWYLMDGVGWYIIDSWHFIDYTGSNSQISFNSNGTFSYVSKNVRKGDKYKLTINRKGTWKRSHQDLTLNFNNALLTVSVESSWGKNIADMSAREKAECTKEQAETQRELRLIKSSSDVVKITRIDDKVMTIKTGRYGLIDRGDNVNGTVFYSEKGLKEIEEIIEYRKNPSPEATFKMYEKKAEQGDADAQCDLGKMYLSGYGIAKDEAKSVEWFRKAAEQGNAEAQYALGIMYTNGSGVAKDDTKAVEWYRKAAEQGNAKAQYALGIMYTYGSGVAKDEAKGVEWFRKAAEQGDATAQYALGIMYTNGSGVAKDEAKAVEWYKKAGEQGNAKAYNELAYLEAKKGHYEEAINTIDKAIKLQPDDPNYYDSKGEILSMKGDKEGAKAMWEKVISLDPNYSEKNSPLYQYLFPSN